MKQKNIAFKITYRKIFSHTISTVRKNKKRFVQSRRSTQILYEDDVYFKRTISNLTYRLIYPVVCIERHS
jgi:hypothetical protein